MNCAIIGAGQLGSRHLQGLLKTEGYELNIFVVDPSVESLTIAEKRAKEFKHQHLLTFNDSIKQLPKHLDFVVIATNSMVRLAVIETLLLNSTVNYLILEKVLFPEIEQYDKAIHIIENHNVKCWVNHPRRMYEDYQSLKKLFKSNKIYSFQLVGSSWGLACNGLHFIDLFEYLTDSNLTTISNELLIGNPLESKRNGYIEFDGTLAGTLNNKHNFSITSLKNQDIVAPTLSIMTDDLRILIQESGTPRMYFFKEENSFALEEVPLQVLYQSQLTGKLLEQIQNSGTCYLPSFKHASSTHQIFIKSILNRWNEVTESNNILLPIT